MVRKKVDPRVRSLIENSVKLRQRGLLVLVGDHGKDQVVNLHLMLSKTQVKARPSVLWCYKKELGFSTHRKKRMRQIKKAQARGTHDPTTDDPFDLFVSQTDIRWCYYRDSHKILGQTFGMLVLQDFEAMTPNLLARTVETVEGGGLVILLLRTVTSLKQLYTMTMDCHDRFRTDAHQSVVPRFNERFILSLSQCNACLVLDDELNILPISSSKPGASSAASSASSSSSSSADASSSEAAVAAAAAAEAAETAKLGGLVQSLADAQPAGALVGVARTLDQAQAVLTFLDAVSEKRLRSTVALTAGRGRGKSAALGLCLAGAVAYGYANIFVTAPSPENLHTVFEFVLKGLDALHYEEHLDYEVLQSTNAEFNKAVVRINIFKEHRQTIQYIEPKDHARLAQAELVVIDEAAAIPLPLVKSLMGPYLVFMASTVNGYEGTGRSLSLKLINDLRRRQGQASLEAASAAAADVAGSARGGKKGERQVHEERWRTAAAAAAEALAAKGASGGGGAAGGGGGRSLREIELQTPIRYAAGDAVEAWLNELLCLDAKHAHANANRLVCGTPSPRDCDLFWVNRDALFSHHSLSESFLQRIMSMYTAAHYKNSPNDLQLLSDAPAHELYVLLGPAAASGGAGRLPDVLCVVQVAFEGRISRQTLGDNMARGRSTAGDLIPWSLSMQFGDDGFATLCGARVVRIATHPDVQKMGYGSRAMQLLLKHFRGNMLDLDASDASDDDDEDTDDDEEEDKDEIDEDEDEEDDDSAAAAAEDDGEGRESGSRSKSSKKKLLREELRPRSKLPPLLVPLASRRPPMLHWCGVSFGVTTPLLNYWLRLGFELTYLRQTKNEVTGEHTAILLCDLTSSSSSSSSDGMLVDRARDDGPRPVDGWLEAFVWDARRRLVSLLAFTFRDFPTAMSLSLLSSGGSVSVDAKALTAADLGMFVTPHDLKRLDMYARNMVDYHLITDILPTLARLYFLGHLSNGSGGEGDLSLSMVQKAIFLGTGLQHRNVDSISAELSLPASQVLALFNKAVRKVNAHLKALVERDAESTIVGSAKKRGNMSRIAHTAAGMAATASTLDEDLEEGAGQALTKLQRKSPGSAAGSAPVSAASAAAAALLAQDEDLMEYSVQGTDEDWEAALRSSGGGSVSSVAVKTKRKESSSRSGGTDVDRVLLEAQEERKEELNQGKKKKRARILGGGFNEADDKGDGAKKKKKSSKSKSKK